MGTGELWEYWSSILKNTILRKLSLEICLRKPSKLKAPMKIDLRKHYKTKAPMEIGFPRPSKTKAPMEKGLQRPSGRSSHGNGSPVAICRSSRKIQKYRVIFPRQNVVNFNTKLIIFSPIAQRTACCIFSVAKSMGAIAYCFRGVTCGPKLWELLLNWQK